ncbi:unnamed protein product [Rotaria magnacalcarata]|uniref:Uncharacterized protein n=1 Tax=Rotaria magnacalcarata TaxID=392030 RepID=A0A820F1Y5_9BILA|nr:unnamed protein product [Rotaria magnacalcarata]CAF4427490.1 unnamed protein product [Rotaria magnacalcarata]
MDQSKEFKKCPFPMRKRTTFCFANSIKVEDLVHHLMQAPHFKPVNIPEDMLKRGRKLFDSGSPTTARN